MVGLCPRRPWVRGLFRLLLTASLSPWILIMLLSRPVPVRAQVAMGPAPDRFAATVTARTSP